MDSDNSAGSTELNNVKMITSMYFVKRNVAKANPEKVQLTEEELKRIVEETSKDGSERSDESDSDDEKMQIDQSKTMSQNVDEFNFDNYDNEEATKKKHLGLNTITTFASDGVIGGININTDDPDSDEEDDIIKPNDNLILVGQLLGDANILEVYVHNEDEGSLYVHHDTILPGFPLCIEWLNRDPGNSAPGNLCAIGYYDPVIHIWDLDIINCLEPAFKLGKVENKKKRSKAVGHTSAVVSLSWNRHMDHILASGSVDETVLLWDIDNGEPHTKIYAFESVVQSIQWHPLEVHSLLTGCEDNMVRVFDCRTDNTYKSWDCKSEIETVLWDPLNPFCFAAGTEERILYFDCRRDEPIWDLKEHHEKVTGLSLSSKCPGLMVTTCMEGYIYIWDLSNGSPTKISEQHLSVGSIRSLVGCPENPFIFAVGGDSKSKNFDVLDITKFHEVRDCFASRQQVQVSIDT